MDILHIRSEDFEQLKTLDKPVLLDFFATWCGPCRMVAPILEEIAVERDDVIVAKVDVDEEPDLAAQFEVTSIPTLVVMKGGIVTQKVMGARPKAQILALLDD